MKFFALIVLLFWSVHPHAKEPCCEADLALIGKADLKIFMFSIYTAALYSADGEYSNTQKPLYLKITYHRNVKAKKLSQYTTKELKNLKVEPVVIRTMTQQLDQIYVDLKKKDELGFLIRRDESCDFYHNSALIGGFSNSEYCKNFLDIWLSEKTSRPKLRKKLLGISRS